MADIDVLLDGPARLFYDEVATQAERKNIDRALAFICEAPQIDNRRTFSFRLGVVGREGVIYTDGRVWITYQMLTRGRFRSSASAL